MRFVNVETRGTLFAVAGTNVVSIAVDMPSALHKPPDGEPLLFGFAIARRRPGDEQPTWDPVEGYRFFRSLVPHPQAGHTYSTFEHPWQSFLYSDFLAQPDTAYEYAFHPVTGFRPAALEVGKPLQILVRTEPLAAAPPTGHEVYFNRGVASSQGYTKAFGTGPIDLMPDTEKAKALAWLSHRLDEAMLRFIADTPSGDRLLCCFYEFTWEPVIQELITAMSRGVDVQVILDWKDNGTPARPKTPGHKAKRAKAASPRDATKQALEQYGFPLDRVTRREARPDAIAHNKFMVRVDTATGPEAVWTGSTNLTLGAVTAQTNVGHIVHDPAVASTFASYWTLLQQDPGSRAGDNRATATRRNAAFRSAVEELSPVPGDLHDVPAGTTVVLSPRRTSAVLDSYASLIDTADTAACLTLPFNEDHAFQVVLHDNSSSDGPFVMVLLNKQPKPTKADPVLLSWRNNVYSAYGGRLDDPVSDWLREAYAGQGGLGLTSFVDYIHSKVILVDPLSDDPIVVSGSANFSVPSLQENDENSIIVRGNTRVADIYFTEFNRLFEHYQFRDVMSTVHHPEQPAVLGLTAESDADDDAGSDAGLSEDQSWAWRFLSFRLRGKRLAAYRTMFVPPILMAADGEE